MDFGCDLYVFLAKFCQTRQLTENYDEHYSDYLQPPGIQVLILLCWRVPFSPSPSSPLSYIRIVKYQDCCLSMNVGGGGGGLLKCLSFLSVLTSLS